MARRTLKPTGRRPEPDAAEAQAERDRRALRPLAARIRLAYIVAFRAHFQARHGVPSNFGCKPIPRWDGGVGPDGRAYQPIWYKVARAARDAGVDPDDLIRYAFSDWDAKDPPWPTRLTSPEVMAKAAARPGVSVEDAQAALRVQQHLWWSEAHTVVRWRGVPMAEAARAVLKNRRLELSSIFRYCQAVAADDAELAAQFEPGAFQQYFFNRRVYDLGWGELIPARLRELADRLSTA